METDTAKNVGGGMVCRGKVNQLGIVVHDAAKAMSRYAETLGIRQWYRANSIGPLEVTVRGEKTIIDVEIYLAYMGSVQVELIESRAGSGGIYAEQLAARGEGLHHVGFFVSNLDKKLDVLRKTGIEPIQSGEIRSRGGAVTRYAYYETGGPGNIIAEFIETKLAGIPVGMSHFMMKIGCLTGDAEKIRL
ncbi:MAG TPA: VOC family protein [Spirochaetota bacterium]|nr:VOC family protein [Spirochaetota bacterium]